LFFRSRLQIELSVSCQFSASLLVALLYSYYPASAQRKAERKHLRFKQPDDFTIPDQLIVPLALPIQIKLSRDRRLDRIIGDELTIIQEFPKAETSRGTFPLPTHPPTRPESWSESPANLLSLIPR
jgi:hypothetical protein